MLEDFLTSTSPTSLGKEDIEKILYNITYHVQINRFVTENVTRGRAIYLGGGYFLTVYHIVSPLSADEFAGVISQNWSVPHMLPPLGKPFSSRPVSQTGTVFANRSPIERLIRQYISTISR